MIRRSPAEFYIKYLMLQPTRLPDETVVEMLREQQLDYPGKMYLKKLRASLRPPTPFYPYTAEHVDSYKFLQKHKVHMLFFPDEHVHQAWYLLRTPRAKEVVEAMLIAEEDPVRIFVRLDYFGIQGISEQSLVYYRHFFMNLSLIDQMEMRALLMVRIEDLGISEDPEDRVRYKAMKQAQYLDPRFLAANSSNKGLASLRLQIRHGLLPNRIEYGRIAEATRTAALGASYECSVRGGPRDAQSARDYSVVATNMDALIRERGGGEDTIRKSLVALGRDTTIVPSVQQLTGGNYTDCVDPVEEEKANASDE